MIIAWSLLWFLETSKKYYIRRKRKLITKKNFNREINMKWIRIIQFSAILILLTSIIPLCNATIEKDLFEHYEYKYSDKPIFAFKLRIVIETETDGSWVVGRDYEIHFIFTLTQINTTRIDYVNISYIIYGYPKLEMQEPFYPTIEVYGIDVGEQMVRTFKVKPISEARSYQLDYRVKWNYTDKLYNESVEKFWDSWRNPIYLHITTADFQTEVVNYLKTILCVLILAIVINIVTIIYLAKGRLRVKSN